MIFVKDVPDPENFGVVVYDETGRVVDIVEKAGVVDKRYAAPPTNDAVVGLYCYPARRLRRDRRASSRRARRARDHRRQPRTTRSRDALDVVRVEGWWEDAGKHWQHLAEIGRRDRRDGREQVSVDGVRRIPLRRFEDERGWFCELAARQRAAEADRPDERLASRGRA